MLANSNVKAEVDAIEREHARACNLTAVRVLRELATIAFHDPLDLYEEDGVTPRPLCKITPRARRAIQNQKTKRRRESGIDGTEWIIEEIDYRTHSKMAALDSLAKHLGLTNDGDVLKKLLEALAEAGPAHPSNSSTGPRPPSGDSANGVGAAESSDGKPVAVPD